MTNMKRFFRHTGRPLAALSELWHASQLYRWTLGASLALVVFSAALPAWRLLPGILEAKFIPLHYNIYFGIDRFGPWYGVFLPAAAGLAIFLLNVVILCVVFRSERFLALLLAWTTLIVELILLVATIFIVSLNIIV